MLTCMLTGLTLICFKLLLKELFPPLITERAVLHWEKLASHYNFRGEIPYIIWKMNQLGQINRNPQKRELKQKIIFPFFVPQMDARVLWTSGTLPEGLMMIMLSSFLPPNISLFFFFLALEKLCVWQSQSENDVRLLNYNKNKVTEQASWWLGCECAVILPATQLLFSISILI